MPLRSFLPLLVLLVAPAGLLAQADAPEPTGDAEILRQFQLRRETVINRTADRAESPKVDSRFTVAANFYRGTRLDWANASLVRAYSTTPHDYVDMFWMFPLVTLMEAGRDGITPATREQIRKEWRTCFPIRGDTENHWLIYYASLCLAAEANPSAGPEAWYNGKSSAENIAEARAYIEDWMRITTSYGQGEFNSPNYLEEYTAPLALLAGWERDPRFRQEARMMLDYIFYDYAVEQLNGEYGGAHSRVYPRQVVEPGLTPAAAIGWLLFGLGEYQPNDITAILAMSGYAPPPILHRIAHDRLRPYVNRELKRTRWLVRHAGQDSFEVEGKRTVAVRNYTYMDPDFVIGSCQGGLLQPIQQESWSLIWREPKPLGRENTLFGLQPYSSPFEASLFFPWSNPDTSTHFIAYTGSVAKADYDSPDKLEGGSPNEQICQHGPALIALYDMPPGNRFPIIDTFFSRDLVHRDPDKSGWIFCQGGPAYFGYRPFAPGEWKVMGWTGLLKNRADGWFSSGFLIWGGNNHCLVSSSLRNGYIVQAAPVRAYRSFEAFKAAVRALPVRISLDPVPEATLTTLDGTRMHARYGAPPEENGVPVDPRAWPLFGNPYGSAARGSARLVMRYGSERYTLDFNAVAVEDTIVPQGK
jgi:hypothetical protein